MIRQKLQTNLKCSVGFDLQLMTEAAMIKTVRRCISQWILGLIRQSLLTLNICFLKVKRLTSSLLRSSGPNVHRLMSSTTCSHFVTHLHHRQVVTCLWWRMGRQEQARHTQYLVLKKQPSLRALPMNGASSQRLQTQFSKHLLSAEVNSVCICRLLSFTCLSVLIYLTKVPRSKSKQWLGP